MRRVAPAADQRREGRGEVQRAGRAIPALAGRPTGGAAGVGRAATEAFVFAFVAILALDFVLAMFSNSLYDWVFPRAPSKVA